MEDTAEALAEEPQDISAMRTATWDRKMANTTTSISFGTDKLNYVSDAMSVQKHILQAHNDPTTRAKEADRVKDMKRELTQTSFTLGDVQPEYESTNMESMRKTAEVTKTYKKIPFNKEAMMAIKRSSLHFGNEKVNYHTVMRDATAEKAGTNDFAALQAQTEELKKNLRKHNFTLGDQKVLYESDYSSGFGKEEGSFNVKHYEKGDFKKEIQKQIDDIRACHFVLGNETVEYKSDAHRQFESMQSQSPQERKAVKDRAKQMKSDLTRTTISLGDDEEYY
jgi:hypothetical protein